MPRPINILPLFLLLRSAAAYAQTAPQLDPILSRLDQLERENLALIEEVRALRAEVAALRPQPETPATTPPEAPAAAQTTDHKLDIQANRIDELEQAKVGSSQMSPVQLRGIVLFNAFLNSHQSGGSEYPTLAVAPGPAHDGATVRQTILGLEFRSPRTLWGGTAHASVYSDFFTGANGEQALRLRTASVQIDWSTRSIMAGLEKPIFNPLEPDSLAQVGVSPLSGAGNLWLWLPQVRFEQDFRFGGSDGLRALMGIVQTREVGPYEGAAAPSSVEPARPGLQGRFEFFHNLDDRRRIEIAPGFHTSTTHAAGESIPSRLLSMDWFLDPWERLELKGALYSGQNVAHLGAGGIQQGYSIDRGFGAAVHSRGGWVQVTLHVLPKLDLHLFSGQQDDRNRDLDNGDLDKNLMFGANLYLRLAPNVLLGLEASQLRSVYIGTGTRLNNHYDVALAYLF